jgi:hypothetical protein
LCEAQLGRAAAGVLPDLALKVVDLGQQLHSRRAAPTQTAIGAAMMVATMPSMRSVLLSLAGLKVAGGRSGRRRR